MDWETVFQTVGISGILIVVIGFVLRSLFLQILSVDMANHQHELEITTEHFRSEIGKAVFEHQPVFQLFTKKGR